ncbi:Transcriptional regulatory protein EmbR [Streptomyces sp. ADI95-17]|nr:Transcriptional regulatory protein EmbR [Streptomyces sp. ADI95-17]
MIQSPQTDSPDGSAPHAVGNEPAPAGHTTRATPPDAHDKRPDPRFGVLGQLSVHGRTMSVTSPVRRAVLTACLLRYGRPIGIAEFSEILWDDPPVSATANLRSHVTGLRRDLDEVEPGLGDRMRTYRGAQCGYGLEIAPDEFDLPRFTAAVQRGRNWLLSGSHKSAVDALEQAVGLWNGPFGQDLPPTRWFNAHIAGLNNARLDAYQDLFTASEALPHAERVLAVTPPARPGQSDVVEHLVGPAGRQTRRRALHPQVVTAGPPAVCAGLVEHRADGSERLCQVPVRPSADGRGAGGRYRQAEPETMSRSGSSSTSSSMAGSSAAAASAYSGRSWRTAAWARA